MIENLHPKHYLDDSNTAAFRYGERSIVKLMLNGWVHWVRVMAEEQAIVVANTLAELTTPGLSCIQFKFEPGQLAALQRHVFPRSGCVHVFVFNKANRTISVYSNDSEAIDECEAAVLPIYSRPKNNRKL